MKKVVICLVSLAVLFMVSAVSAQEVKTVDGYVSAGLSLPTGDLGDGWKLGYHLAGRMGFDVAPKVRILVGVGLHAFPLDDRGTGVDGGNITVVPIMADIKLNLGLPGASANPYLLGGIGMANLSFSDLTYQGQLWLKGESETDFAVEIGGGVDFDRFFVQGKFVNVFTEGSDLTFIPFSFGLKF